MSILKSLFGLGLLAFLGACSNQNDSKNSPDTPARTDTLPSMSEKYERSLSDLSVDENGQADLLNYGVAAKIPAPKTGVKVLQTGKLVPSLTLRDRDSFWISVETLEFTKTRERAKLKAEALADAQKLTHFSRIVQDDAHGFVFELDFDGKKFYNFRYIVVSQQLYHIFRTSILRPLSLEQVQALYRSVQTDNPQ